jgi:cytochrome c-type biogenesis protein CcmF
MLLINNVLLLAAAATVLLGTLYPLFLDALNLGKISVGPPYFEAVFVPLMMPVLFLLAVGPFVRWKESSMLQILQRLRLIALATLLCGVALAIFWSASVMVVLGVSLAIWILLATASHLLQRLMHAKAGTSIWARISREPLSYWGMLVAHAGIAVFVIGVTLVKGFDSANDVSMRVGDVTSVGGYNFRFSELKEIKGPNYLAARGIFEVSDAAGKVAVMSPEKRFYTVQNMPMTEAAIDRGFTRDLYVSLGEAGAEDRWVVRVQHKPFVAWIWGGCLIMALGGFLAASDRRYRIAARRRAVQSLADASVQATI